MVQELEWTMNSGQKVQPTCRYGAGSGVDPHMDLGETKMGM